MNNNQETKLKELLGEACVEIAKWKQRAQDAEKKLAQIELAEKKYPEFKRADWSPGVVRLPLGKVKS